MLRTIGLSLAAILLSGPALCQTPASRTVTIPVELKTAAEVSAYTDALIRAAEDVCRREAGPTVGTAFDVYRACRTKTLADTAAKEPTGLLAGRLGLVPPLALASN